MEQGYANALFLLSLVTVIAGAASVALAILALRVLNMRNWGEQQPTADSQPGKELLLLRDSDRILGHETDTEVRSNAKVRRSPMLSAEGRRDYFNR